MPNTISCPSCKTEIEITEAIEARLSDELRRKFEAEFRQKEESVKALNDQLIKEKAEVADSRAQLDELVNKKVESLKQGLLEKAKIDAAASLDVEIKDRDQQLEKLRSDLSKANTLELEFRKKNRELEERSAAMELEVSRKLDAERDEIKSAVLKQAAEEYRLKEAENEKRVSEMKSQIDDLKRKAEQGSVQTQGEVLELDLEAMLEDSFPYDSIEPVPKGVSGADAKQIVRTRSGKVCGSILWESKRTKSFSKSWLPKLRDDQRASKSAAAILVTDVLPEGVINFELIDGVWVCNRICAQALATALRLGIIESAKSALAAEGRTEKTELVYQFIAGNEFRQCIEGMVESVISMQSDLESEIRSCKRQWSKREKQIERAITNMAAMYGNLQGIVGGAMPTVEGLIGPPCLENGSDEASSAA